MIIHETFRFGDHDYHYAPYVRLDAVEYDLTGSLDRTFLPVVIRGTADETGCYVSIDFGDRRVSISDRTDPADLREIARMFTDLAHYADDQIEYGPVMMHAGTD